MPNRSHPHSSMGFLGLVVGVLALIVAVTVPEIRRVIGLDADESRSQNATNGNDPGPGQPAPAGDEIAEWDRSFLESMRRIDSIQRDP